ncbi:hypothetical protein K1719_003349 [Acacia pycnantha]|nr:hypothetical protein K1719_003349 [Acacia pycnantha]
MMTQLQVLLVVLLLLEQPQISQDQNPEAGGHDGIVNPEAGGHGGIINTEATHVTKDDDDFCIEVEKIFELLDDYELSLQEFE